MKRPFFKKIEIITIGCIFMVIVSAVTYFNLMFYANDLYCHR